MQDFTTYYQNKHNRRLLKWCFSLGNATVSARFPQSGRVFDCVVGTFQMCIIMLFNSPAGQSGQLSFRAIKEAMKMDDDTCSKNLRCLMNKGVKLLEIRSDESGKETPGKSNVIFHDQTLLGINEAFTSQLNRIMFPTPVLEEVYKKGKFTLNYKLRV